MVVFLRGRFIGKWENGRNKIRRMSTRNILSWSCFGETFGITGPISTAKKSSMSMDTPEDQTTNGATTQRLLVFGEKVKQASQSLTPSRETWRQLVIFQIEPDKWPRVSCALIFNKTGGTAPTTSKKLSSTMTSTQTPVVGMPQEVWDQEKFFTLTRLNSRKTTTKWVFTSRFGVQSFKLSQLSIFTNHGKWAKTCRKSTE